MRKRPYRRSRVVGQERDHSVDVTILDRLGEAADDIALEPGARDRRPNAVLDLDDGYASALTDG